MFGLEIIFIGVVCLLLFGPEKLPEIARQAGRMFVILRRMTSDVRSTVDTFVREAEEQIRREEREVMQKVLGSANVQDQLSPLNALPMQINNLIHGDHSEPPHPDQASAHGAPTHPEPHPEGTLAKPPADH